VVEGDSAFVGHVTSAPLHVSAGSHAPALARHTCTTPATESAGQSAVVPVHLSARSQVPALARQTVVAGANPFAGQFGVPLHDSAGSQVPVLARHTTLAPRFVQVPFALAPAATEHAWQPPEHAALQQKPSTQLPPVH
jgi:hypothetical protein